MMEKIKFQYLYSFKYHGKEYIYLTAKHYPFYFIEYNPHSQRFDYPDLETFKELYNKFYDTNNKLYFKKANSIEKIKKALNNLNINIVPLVKTTSGLLSLVLALSMCGCTTIDKPFNQETSAIVDTYNKDQEIKNYFKNYNMDVISKEYDGNDYIFVKEFINTNNKKQITLQNFEDFRKHINLSFIPTWNDVINAFQTNSNIDPDKKSIILDSITNMKQCEELKGMDLSVLYINAQRMKFKYLSSEEMKKTVGKDSVYAFFDANTGTVYLPNDKPLEKFEFVHEVLGHGSLAYREETANSLVVFDCTNYLMLPNDNRYTGYSVGIMVSEGGANMIAHFATNDYSVSNFYELYEEELRVIADLCHVSIGQLFNYKGIDLYDLMYKNNINTPVEYIFKMDGIYKGLLYCEFSDLMERLFIDATEEKFMSSNPEEQDTIIKLTVALIKDSHFKNKTELNFDYDGGAINYNFEESANSYEEHMNQLRGSK